MVKAIVFASVESLETVNEEKVRGAIARLAEKGIPVILFGDGDRAEMEPIRDRLEITAPFIVEGGSAIFTPVDSNPFEDPLGEQDGNYFVYELGCPYVQARAGLRVIANAISHPLKGFGDFTVQQLERSLKVSENAAHRAKAREFSEPFMTPKSVDLDELKQSAKEMGFDVVLRDSADSRFSLLRGADASLTVAAEAVVSAYEKQIAGDNSLKVVGVVSQQDELDYLSKAKGSADFRGVLVSESADVEMAWLEAADGL